MQFNKNKGFSLIEVLLVLGFAAVLIAGAFLAYSSVKSSSQVNRTAQNVSMVAAGIKALYANSPDYEGLSNELVINANIAPEEWVNGDTLVHGLGSGGSKSILISPTNERNRTDGEMFRVHVYNSQPNVKQCVALIKTLAPQFDAVWLKSGYNAGGVPMKRINQKLNLNRTIDYCNRYGRHGISFISK